MYFENIHGFRKYITWLQKAIYNFRDIFKNPIITLILVYFQSAIGPTKLRLNDDYAVYYHNHARLIVTGLIPLITLINFNCKIYESMKIRRQNMQGEITCVRSILAFKSNASYASTKKNPTYLAEKLRFQAFQRENVFVAWAVF